MFRVKECIKNLSPESWLILLVAVGYVFASGLAIPLQVENSRLFAIPYRLLIFGLSLWILGRNLTVEKLKTVGVISFVLFWLLYGLKVYLSFFQDLYLPDFRQTESEIFWRLLLIISLPGLALMVIDYSKVNLKKIAKALFFIFFVMLILNLLWYIPGEKRANVVPYIFSVYYISAGHYGTSLTLISLFFLLFYKSESSKREVWLYRAGLAVGLVSVVILTARSPFLGVLVTSLYLLLIRKKTSYLIVFAFLILAALALIFLIGTFYPEYNGFFKRTYNWIYLGDTSQREPLFERSLTEFKKNPLLGGRVLYEDGMYPHNIFLELLMATGIVGMVVYWLKFIPVLTQRTLFLTKSGGIYPILFFALFLQYFTLVWTSYNLYSVPEFVHFSSIIIGMSISFKKKATGAII